MLHILTNNGTFIIPIKLDTGMIYFLNGIADNKWLNKSYWVWQDLLFAATLIFTVIMFDFFFQEDPLFFWMKRIKNYLFSNRIWYMNSEDELTGAEAPKTIRCDNNESLWIETANKKYNITFDGELIEEYDK